MKYYETFEKQSSHFKLNIEKHIWQIPFEDRSPGTVQGFHCSDGEIQKWNMKTPNRNFGAP